MKLLLIFVFVFIGFANFANDKLVVFDGGGKQEGKSWVHPRGLAKMDVTYQNPFSNKAHLSFDVTFQEGWAGAGWNWASWKEKGTDLSDYKFLVFRIGLSKSKIEHLFVILTSNNGKGADAKGSKVMILPMIGKRNKYIKITIPLEKLNKKDLNIKEVWGINFEVYGVENATDEVKKKKTKTKSEKSCKIFIDQIEFTK